MEKSFLNRSYLDRQANQIERVLSTMSLPARVQGGQVTDRWVRYHLEPTAETKTSDVLQAAEAVADAIGADGVRMANRGDGIAIEVPHMRSKVLRLLPLMHAIHEMPALNALVGMQTSGKPLILDMNQPSTWHLLALGRAGCGKSELLRTLAASLCLTSKRSELNILGVDIGGHELGMIEAIPHILTDLATDREFAKELILWLAQEVRRRLQIGIRKPHLVLFVDDFTWLDTERSQQIHKALNEIVLKGFESGVHVIGASREPISLPLHSAQKRGGMVTALAAQDVDRNADKKTGRFHMKAGASSRVVDAAFLSARDLDTFVHLVNSGWRSVKTPSGIGFESRS
jgi:DNA segregation ATPase FtsK/SpoIIIE-like protein